MFKYVTIRLEAWLNDRISLFAVERVWTKAARRANIKAVMRTKFAKFKLRDKGIYWTVLTLPQWKYPPLN